MPLSDIPQERRTCARHPLARQPSCIVQDEESCEFLATLCDVCVGGLGLISCIPLAVGTVVPVALFHQRSRLPYLRLLRVVHLRAVDAQRWMGGGRFLRPLTEGEMGAILERDQVV